MKNDREGDPEEQSATEEEHAATRWSLVVGGLFVFALAVAWYLQSTIPRHIVVATGLKEGMYHEYAEQYRKILARDGLKLEERPTAGAQENGRLLLDPKSGVDIAFYQGGVASEAESKELQMLVAIYYEPLWIFYRGEKTLTQVDHLRYKRIAIGVPGSGVRAFAEPILAANNVTGFNSQLVPLVGVEALRALQRNEVDAAIFVGAARADAIWQALHDEKLKLMSLERAASYERVFPYVRAMSLPSGSVDLALDIPHNDTKLIATKAMIVAREGLPRAIIDLIVNAADELHGQHGLFEADDEFPNTHPVDLPVSPEAERHLKFGPGLLHRYLPFFVASYVERLVIVLLPLVFLLIPAINFLPRFFDWRVRSRIYRWYGELSMLERDVRLHAGVAPTERWLADIDRIEQRAARIRTPPRFASEAYTLREHIGLVRRAVMARASGAGPSASE